VSLAYFPLYADKYEADTAHLSMLEDGAYNRLLRLCWRSPGCKLPNDLPWIFRQCRATTDADRAAVEAVLSEYFSKGRGKIWSDKLLKVHVQVSVMQTAKSEGGKKGAAAKALKNNKTDASIAKADLEYTSSIKNQIKNQKEREEGGGGSASAREISDPTFREKILTAIGVDPVSGLTGHGGRQLGTQVDMAEAGRWLELPGVTPEAAVAEVARISAAKRDGPPKSFGYFTEAMRRLSASITAPSLQPTTAEQPTQPTARLFDLSKMGQVQ